ncbi:ATP-dependent DNA helicase RecG [Eubacterium oxidoreducens]|uniref:ATP-dependent DNA helicase RecG n=1 Tax=Eubacterium oxidoreducens TaxID=1732 RepID=A0A1G6AMJ0_EUBOX|nr:ATP-dependent DNA helicase RecG [Eubacterium oxidoreducens]SDB09604.1 ATP-dependent DNA helicase RecG [Eubacterium oxidoreducens]
MNLDSKITQIKGVGKKTEELFENLGVYTVGDMLLNFPREYKLYPHPLSPGDVYLTMQQNPALIKKEWAVEVKAVKSPVVRAGRRTSVTVLSLKHNLLDVEAVWFRSDFLRSVIKAGHRYILYGKCEIDHNRLKITQPKVFSKEQYQIAYENRLIPVYRLTKGLKQHQIIKAIQNIFEDDIEIIDWIPEEIRKHYGFPNRREAIYQMHFPDFEDKNIAAQKRLAFEEFFLFLLSIKSNEQFQGKEKSEYKINTDEEWQRALDSLLFPLTNDQTKALNEILMDMQSDYRMQRLLEGDVGSGKTIVAFLSMLAVAFAGWQSALMAPTEVLARQHYETFKKLIEDMGLADEIPVILLVGSMSAKEKQDVYECIECMPTAMIIGTHALIQEKVNYQNLAYVVTDEQHRFGVKQREAFGNKGMHPHILVMSATPIPRTLALILYNNIDISRILEKPANRLPIKNCVVGDSYLPAAYKFMKEQIEFGHQCYVICPMIEENEESQVRSVEEVEKMLREQFEDSIAIGVMHGNLKTKEKNDVMHAFELNEISILVSTTVVEVGVDVPNATMMMVFNAERFGLAQLHQLRGRIGRGAAQSYCVFLSDSSKAKERLEILNKSNDGFQIADEDLKQRGPGDFFGERQSGDMGFGMADPYRDSDMLKEAAKCATELLQVDPKLLTHKLLKAQLERYRLNMADNLNI